MSKRLSVESEKKEIQPGAEIHKLQEGPDEAKDMGHSEAYKKTERPDDGSNLIDHLRKMEIGNDNGIESKSALRSDFLEEGMDKRALREAKLEGKRKDKEDVGKDDGGAHTEMSKVQELIEDDDWVMAMFASFGQADNACGAEEVQTLTPAERLKQIMVDGGIPTDPVVRETFGFSKVNSQEEETCLMGLYKGLLVLLPNPASVQTVQGWVNNNKLAGGIYYTYKSQGANSGYFKWFKKNQQYFDLNKECPNGPRAPAESGSRLDIELLNRLTSKGR